MEGGCAQSQVALQVSNIYPYYRRDLEWLFEAVSNFFPFPFLSNYCTKFQSLALMFKNFIVFEAMVLTDNFIGQFASSTKK